MIEAIKDIADQFLKQIEKRPVRIISHHDTDGITSATIIAKTLKRLDKKFSIKIVKNLEEETLKKELEKNQKETLIFTDLASGSLEHLQNLENPIFILDHHEIHKDKLNDKIKIVNPHLFDEEEICGAGLSYLFSKAISEENKDLAKLAIVGMIGDRLDSNLSKINQQIINDAEDLMIKKGLLLYPATRALRRSLEYSTSFYIPGVTGSGNGTIELLRETGIPFQKSLYDLTEEEMSKLLTAIMIRMAKDDKKDQIIGNLYSIKFFNTKEDVRELSVLINACSRLGHSDTAIAFCMQNKKAKQQAKDIYAKYKQALVSGLKKAEEIDKIKGNGFVIINAKDEIQDTIIGTVTSILSSGLNYEEGTVLIGMAYNKDKIKVSARISGREGRNLKEVLEKTVIEFKQKHNDCQAEVGGHHFAAGCLVEKEKENDFVEMLKNNLEIEVMKV